MPSSPPRTMKLTGTRAESYCSSTSIPIDGSGLCHAATIIVSSSCLPLKNERMIGILLNLLSFTKCFLLRLARSIAIPMLARMLTPLMSCILTPLLARILKARIAIPLGTCMLIVRASLVLLEIAFTTAEFRICAFPARRATVILSGALRPCDTLMSFEKAHQSE
jgi:hypothetical protein